MSITNEPIMLNETGVLIKEALDRQNGYLAMIAEGRRSEIYNSMAEIASIVRKSNLADLPHLFPIGDQIIMPWKDMDDPNHNTDETAYQVAWNFVHHGMVTRRDGARVPGLFIQMHKCSAYGVQFSAPQAFINCPDGLAAGTYYFVLNAKYDTIAANTMLEFTLTQAVPVNGRIKMATNRTVTTWAAGGTEAIETVTATIVTSSSGTSLGVTGSGGNLNLVARMQYGSNRWSTSAIRQYLNGFDLNWWESKEKFDIRPDQYNKHGFMAGLSDDFLAAIKPIKVATALNTVEGYESTFENTYDTFFLPSLEQMNVSPQLVDVEGEYFEYWRERLAATGFVGTGSSNVFDAFKIPAINANTAQTVRLRSASRGSAGDAWGVGSSGCVYGYGAYSAYRFSPVCVIC